MILLFFLKLNTRTQKKNLIKKAQVTKKKNVKINFEQN